MGQAGHLLDQRVLTDVFAKRKSCFHKKKKVTFPRKPVRGFSLIGELGAEVFVLLRRPLLCNHKHQGHNHHLFMFIILDFHVIVEDSGVDEADDEEADGEGGEK